VRLRLVYIRETRPEKIESSTITFRAVMAVRRDRSFLMLCSLSAVFWFFFAQWISVLPVYSNDSLGIGAENFGLLFALSAVMVVTLQMWVTSRMVKFRRSVVLASGQLVASVGFALIFLATDFLTLAGCIVVITIGEILYMSIISAIIADLAPESERGIYMGFSGMVQQIGNGLGFLAGMYLLGALTDTSVIWLIFGTAGVVSVFGYYFFARSVGPDIEMPKNPSVVPSEGLH
jgi:MFS family permease